MIPHTHTHDGERVKLISVESKNFEKGVEDNLSAPSSFIANAHNEIYAFYTCGKQQLFEKNMSQWGVAAPTAPPFESATEADPDRPRPANVDRRAPSTDRLFQRRRVSEPQLLPPLARRGPPLPSTAANSSSAAAEAGLTSTPSAASHVSVEFSYAQPDTISEADTPSQKKTF